MKQRRTAPTLRRPLTMKRSWSWSTDETTGVKFTSGFVSGVYEARIKGNLIAQTTDKWMAEIILAEAVKGRSPTK